MTYTGTLLKDLQTTVEACLQSNARICAICQQRYGSHSMVGARFPIRCQQVRYLQTSFAER